MEKLVRDKIIQKIFSRWDIPQFRQVSWQEKLEFLLEKLIEEALELKKDRNIEELADVEEVILALYNHLGWSKQEIEKARVQKLEKNWGFEEWYILKMD